MSFLGDIKAPLSDMIWESAPDSGFAEVTGVRLAEVDTNVSLLGHLIEKENINLHPVVAVVAPAVVHEASVSVLENPAIPQSQPERTAPIASQPEAKVYQFPTSPATAPAPMAAPTAEIANAAMPMDELARQRVKEALAESNPIVASNQVPIADEYGNVTAEAA